MSYYRRYSKKCSSTLDIHFEILRSQKYTIRSKYVVFHVRAGLIAHGLILDLIPTKFGL